MNVLIKPNFKKTKEQENFCKLFENTWFQIYKTFKQIFAKEILEENCFKSLFTSIQSWIHISGNLKYNKARDSFLKLICQASVPENNSDILQYRQIYSNKILYNVAHCLGGLFYYFFFIFI